MTSDRLKRVTSKIEAAVERLSQLDPEAFGPNDPTLFEEASGEILERHRRETEDRDRKIAKLRADLDDISNLKDQEIATLREKLARAQQSRNEESVDAADHAALRRRYDRLKAAARIAQERLDSLIGKMEAADG